MKIKLEWCDEDGEEHEDEFDLSEDEQGVVVVTGSDTWFKVTPVEDVT